jgi:hypothetical protein
VYTHEDWKELRVMDSTEARDGNEMTGLDWGDTSEQMLLSHFGESFDSWLAEMPEGGNGECEEAEQFSDDAAEMTLAHQSAPAQPKNKRPLDRAENESKIRAK